MRTEAKISRMRRLIAEAVPATPSAIGRHFSLLRGFNPVLTGPLRRRSMVKQIQLAARRYDLRDDVDAFLAVAGVASLAGLDIHHVEILAAWVESTMDGMATGCDSPDAPPAF